MPSVVLRLWVLVLALLFQAGSWRSDTSSSLALAASTEAPASSMGDFDAQEDSEEFSAVDDLVGGDLLPHAVPKWCNSAPSGRWYPWIDGLSPGGPPSDTPFKPPRS